MNATRVTFSGMVMLAAGAKKAEVALLRHPHHEHREGHKGSNDDIPEHFPIVAVREDQIQGDVGLEEVDSDELIAGSWLRAQHKWKAYRVANHDLSFAGLDVHNELMVPQPTEVSECPTEGWDDLGWLVPFWRMIPGGSLEDGWQRNDAVTLHTTLPNGSVVGRPPVDFPTQGARRFTTWSATQSWVQAFTDAFVWSSAVEDGTIRLTFSPRGGGAAIPIRLHASEGDRLDVNVFNHPDMAYRTSLDPPKWHLGIMKQIFASKKEHPEPKPDGTNCSPVGASFFGSKYCGAPMVKL